ncbi:hypothetical protein [Telluribacter humicola]|uniref:hypothetical protein n=1 Tax=Telluribacter humicola TaxID=1720261 RepID=UPI001A97609D|nr:hypothetical protein [Telluribacter humicola]
MEGFEQLVSNYNSKTTFDDQAIQNFFDMIEISVPEQQLVHQIGFPLTYYTVECSSQTERRARLKRFYLAYR